MSRIIVEYDPNITEKGKSEIKELVNPSMISADGSTDQYHLDYILEEVVFTNPADKFVLEVLLDDNVSYIEF